MLYRSFGRTGEKVSILGFGCMRLPVIDGRRDAIDVPLATKMLHYAIDQGLNYIDTAYPYHGASFGKPGNSEGFVGGALAGGYREKVLVATKLPVWMVNTREEMDRMLEGQLERLGTDRIDCYLLHGLNEKMWAKMLDLGALEFLDRARAGGRIKYAGFSFHDERPAFKPIVDGYDWDFCQIQYNYMDVDFQAGRAGLVHAAAKGLAVIVMEPVKGGRLAVAPQPVQAVLDTAPVKRSPAEWALRYVWDDPRVSLLLSGMTTMEQVLENVRLAGEALPNSLTSEEHAIIDRVRAAYAARTAVDCTACRYCMPCPQGIDIPMMFDFVNDAALFGDYPDKGGGYKFEVSAGHTAPLTACEECGQCEEACPQQIKIPEELKKAAAVLC